MAERKRNTHITPAQRKKFFSAREAGYNITQAAKMAKISVASAYRIMDAVKTMAQETHGGDDANRENRRIEAAIVGPKRYDQLCAEAKRALVDFDYFRLRYFGRLPTPWQRIAAEELVRLTNTEDKEFVVLNCPPGVGKTTLIHDLVCWMICRNRKIRILMGSATQALGERSLMQVRRSLERVTPELAPADDIARGLAADALTTMAQDFGRFKPLDREVWTKTSFVVMQEDDDGAISAKEATVTAYGLDSTYIGGRFDACLWDDTQDGRRIRSQTVREQTELDWEDVAENRVDPAGMMAVIGQRLAPDDIYRFCLDMVQPLDEEDEDALDYMTEEERSKVRRDKKYKSIIFKAHYEELCLGRESHMKSAKPYPDGCLLDPRRLTWRELSAKMARGTRYRVVYQQEDVALEDVLVQRDWVFGSDRFPGCIDKDRDVWDIPRGISASDCLVVVSADPSPTNYWSIQCWIYHKPSELRYLVNHHRAKMEAPDFLDYLQNEREYVGIMQEWQLEMSRRGFPIEYWIVERNGAQRFMLQYDMVKKWTALNSVQIEPHDTARNKSDSDLGVTTLGPHYQFGRVRLMGKGEGKVRSMKLIDEVTRYTGDPRTGPRTDDCVMAQWFFEWNLDRLFVPNIEPEPDWRPEFAKAGSW